jgi:adenine C2-methylase RlmN of 23S rRNA A2503 and tRNA A37
MIRRSVLVIEDDETLRLLLKEYIENLGWRALSFSSAEEAFQVVEKDHFDLLLVDNHLPGKDGLSFIRELINAGNKTPTILMTGYGTSKNIVTSQELGVKFFLAKPFSLEKLRNAMERAIKFSFNGIVSAEEHEEDDTVIYVHPYTIKNGEKIFFEFVSFGPQQNGAEKWPSICISCQIGCMMGCQFCRTGFLVDRAENINLDTLRNEVTIAKEYHGFSGPVEIVFGGGGEFLLNRNAWELIRSTQDSRYRFRVFTIGLLKPLSRFLDEFGTDERIYKIQISGHFPDQDQREHYMRGTRNNPLAKALVLIENGFAIPRNCLADYNYTLYRDINALLKTAEKTAKLLKGRPFRVRLSEANDFGCFRHVTDQTLINQIESIFLEAEIPTTRFVSRGKKSKAGCGQLSTNIKLAQT